MTVPVALFTILHLYNSLQKDLKKKNFRLKN